MDEGLLRERLAAVRARIAAACARAGRPVESVRLIGATKTVPAALVAAAYRAGLHEFGENRVQEGIAKRAALAALGYRPVWHFIGRLQTNKAAAAISAFDILHSVDRLRLAEVLSRRAERTVPVLLEVNIGGEASKAGWSPADLRAAFPALRALPNLAIRGLMAIPPLVADPEASRPYFRALRALAQELGLAELSMGMTNDFEVAIEEGATMVRVGRAIFGERS
jgi:pyridoxal phosphate enzyme (YggS family)